MNNSLKERIDSYRAILSSLEDFVPMLDREIARYTQLRTDTLLQIEIWRKNISILKESIDKP